MIDALASLGACLAVVAAFLLARRAAAGTRNHPLANPILLAAMLVGMGLWFTGLPLDRFAELTRPLRWLLGPAIVALALPIWENRATIRRTALPLFVAVAVGSLTGITSAVGLARLLDLDPLFVAALAPKSVTSPFAIALMTRLGGSAELAAGLVIVTGILGAILLPPLLRVLRLDESETMGVAVGQAAHIVGTDALARRDRRAAAFAALAMTIAGLATSLLLPLLWRHLF